MEQSYHERVRKRVQVALKLTCILSYYHPLLSTRLLHLGVVDAILQLQTTIYLLLINDINDQKGKGWKMRIKVRVESGAVRASVCVRATLNEPIRWEDGHRRLGYKGGAVLRRGMQLFIDPSC